MKVLLVGCVIIALIMNIVMGALLFFVWVPPDDTRPENIKAIAEGRDFGKTTDQEGCMKEALDRAQSLSLWRSTAVTRVTFFLRGCLNGTSSTDTFCEGIPSFWDLSNWDVEQCEKRHMDIIQTSCRKVFSEQRYFCSGSPRLRR
jgi:hypothetical protein